MQGVPSLPEELEVHKSRQASLIALISEFGNANKINKKVRGCDGAHDYVRTENSEVCSRTHARLVLRVFPCLSSLHHLHGMLTLKWTLGTENKRIGSQ